MQPGLIFLRRHDRLPLLCTHDICGPGIARLKVVSLAGRVALPLPIA